MRGMHGGIRKPHDSVALRPRATAVSAGVLAYTALNDHADSARTAGSLTATGAGHRLANISVSAAPAFNTVFRSALSAPLPTERTRRDLPVESPSHPGHSRPLDAQLRADMEPRFGYDFSRVRIYTDPQAARLAGAMQARAYTLGQSVVFGAGHYRPGTAAGRQLLAHELAHVVQQGSGATTPQVQCAPLVTSGQYGQELGEFMDNFMSEEAEKKKLVAMLKGSPTFLSMARFLDSRVLRASERDFTKFDFDEDGWLVTVKGKRPTDKRLLGFAISHAGSYFSPFGQNVPWLGDLINIQFPAPWKGTDEQLDDLSSTIAHETGHAVRLIQGTSGKAPDAATAIKRGIAEEAAVRKTEASVMEEIRKKGLAQPAKAPTSKAEKIAAIESGVATADVERSFVSMKPTKTYLELFLLEHVKASHKGKMTFDEVSKLKATVDKFVIDPKLLDATYTLQDYAEALTLMVLFGNDPDLPMINLDYALYYLVERLIGMRWDRFMTNAREGRIAADAYFGQKEAILQGHLQFLQAGKKVAYAPRIAHTL